MKPNLLFIFTDQQRRETLGCYPGTPAALQTPHLNRLAAESVVFERAYCAQPVCTPSRSTLLTGLYPHATGCIDNNLSLPSELPTLAEMVWPGYHRAYMGKWHLGNELSAQHGFTTWLSTEDNYVANKGNATAVMGASDYTRYLLARGYMPDEARNGVALFSRRQTARLPEADFRTTYLGRQAARFIREAATRDEPFVVYVGFQEPHPPYLGPLDDLYPPDELPIGPTFRQRPPAEAPRLVQMLADSFTYPAQLYGQDMTTEAAWRKTRAKYYGLVTLVDRAVGEILAALDESGQADNTVVVFTSDHGDMLGDHHLWGKSVLYDSAATVPLLIRAPWLTSAPQRITEPFSQVDLVPTLLDLLDQPLPPGLHGHSRAARLAGQAPPAGDDVVVEWNGSSGHHWHKSWKATGLRPDLAWEQVHGPRRSLISPDGYKLNLAAHDAGELYDLNADPAETHNQFQLPERQPRARPDGATTRLAGPRRRHSLPARGCMTQPNLVLIMTDQQRWDALGAAGNSAIHTPHLDRLAARGTTFGQSFSPAPVCAPARASLMTGLSPSRLRFTANEGHLRKDHSMLAERLNQAGYFTAGLGKLHLTMPKGSATPPWELTGGFQHRVISEETRWVRQARSLDEVGFDDYDRYLIERGLWGWGTPPEIGYNEIKPVLSALPEEHGVTAWLGRQAAAWLRQPPAQPFFLFASFVKPHAPYDPPAEWASLYDPNSLPPPLRRPEELHRLNPYYAEERRWREWHLYSEEAERLSRAYYYANISLIDQYVGDMLDALDASGQAENTYAIFTSDHGDMLGDHWAWFKNLAYDGAARVPLIVAGPGVPAGTRVDASVATLLDVHATLLARAGLPAPEGCPGRDLLDFTRPENPATRELTVLEVNKPGQRTRAVRTCDWLYVHWENGGFEELYDLRADPGQLNDLSGSTAHASRRRGLRAALVDWLRSWGDAAWELNEAGDLSEHAYQPRRAARWLPRPHGRDFTHASVAPNAWEGDDDKLWFWRALGGDYSRLLDLARRQQRPRP